MAAQRLCRIPGCVGVRSGVPGSLAGAQMAVGAKGRIGGDPGPSKRAPGSGKRAPALATVAQPGFIVVATTARLTTRAGPGAHRHRHGDGLQHRVHFLMAHEGQSHSWATALYWTITTMSMLGYGDVTFTADAGRSFSMLVLVSGVLLILVLLPFAFVQFVIAPWVEQREAAKTPRKTPTDLHGHLIMVGRDVVTQALIARANRAGTPAVVLVDEPKPTPPTPTWPLPSDRSTSRSPAPFRSWR